MQKSSTAVMPQFRKALKRSASTASLPTPPRTHRKRARGRSRGSCDSDSDGIVASSSEKEDQGGHHKKRRTEAVDTSKDENAFWLGGPSDATESNGASSKSPVVPLLYRKRNVHSIQADVAPVSPPPSHRKSAAVAAVVTPKISSTDIDKSPHVASPPSTPKRPLTRSTFRDSPNNPFLASPVPDTDSPDISASSADPSPHTPNYDKPHITYVFRGMRRTYQNPHYNQAEGRPLSPPVASTLPMDHPDYSPSAVCPPKRLFQRHNRKSSGSGYMTRSKVRQRSNSQSGEEAGAVSSEIRPKKLDFQDSRGSNEASPKAAGKFNRKA